MTLVHYVIILLFKLSDNILSHMGKTMLLQPYSDHTIITLKLYVGMSLLHGYMSVTVENQNMK